MNKPLSDSTSIKTKKAWAVFPLKFISVIFLISIPFWIAGEFISFRILPGLPISSLMFLCTAFTAYIFAVKSGGTFAVKILMLRIIDFKRIPSAVWLIAGALLMPVVLCASYVIMRVANMPLPETDIPWLLTPILFSLFFVAAIGEELAWSATLLDTLQSSLGALTASLILGIVTALWHVVPFAQAHPSANWVLGQCLFTVAFRVILVWLYNKMGQSLFAVVVFHAMYNVAWQMFPNRGSSYNPWIVASITGLIALVVLFSWRSKSLIGRKSNSSINQDA